jgi:hypothetical protein
MTDSKSDLVALIPAGNDAATISDRVERSLEIVHNATNIEGVSGAIFRPPPKPGEQMGNWSFKRRSQHHRY